VRDQQRTFRVIRSLATDGADAYTDCFWEIPPGSTARRAGATVLGVRGGEAWGEPLIGGSHALALLNRGSSAIHVAASAVGVGLPGAKRYRLRNGWSHRTSLIGGEIAAEVAPYSSVLVRSLREVSARRGFGYNHAALGAGGHRIGTVLRCALASALAALCVALAPTGALAATNITGTWDCCGAGGAAEQDFVITDSSGSLSGKGLQPDGASFAVITGSVSGSSVTIVTTYEASFASGYVATFVGTVAASGQTMSGTWLSNAGQSGTWSATLAGGSGPSTTKKGSSFTAVQCTISAVAPETSTCTAQVAGYGSSHLVSPTGTVSFSASSGTVGTSCVLAATPGSPGISSCTVSYVPSASLSPGIPPPVSAHYSGDSNFGPASGESSYVPHSVVLFEDESVAEDTEISDGGTSEGIPVDLTNPNPFPVSADEMLTVSGYPSVANTSSASATALAARTQVIGHVSLKVAPLQTIATKVKLSPGGAKLLKKHKRLKAMLVVVTKRAGQPAKTVRRKLLIKI
jgi:hypothetical protein